MRWTVEGADKATGHDRVIQVEAHSSAEAERIASQKGLLVSGVYEPTNLEPAEQLARMASQSPIKFDPPPNASQPIAYQSLSPLSRRAPDYFGLKFGGLIMMIFACVYYAAGVVLLFIGLVGMAGVAVSRDPRFAVFGGSVFVAWALMSVMAGGILHALATGCSALRDIARNSFSR